MVQAIQSPTYLVGVLESLLVLSEIYRVLQYSLQTPDNSTRSIERLSLMPVGSDGHGSASEDGR